MLEKKNWRWFLAMVLFTSILFLSQNYRLDKHLPDLPSYSKLTSLFQKNPEDNAKHLEGKEFDLKRVLRAYGTDENAVRVPTELFLLPRHPDMYLHHPLMAAQPPPKQEADHDQQVDNLPKNEQNEPLKKEEETPVKTEEAKEPTVEKDEPEDQPKEDQSLKEEEASLEKKEDAPQQETPVKKDELEEQAQEEPPAESAIVNPHDFNIMLDPGSSLCGDNHGKDLFFLIYVHTAPDHVEQRNAIRQTWANIDTFPDSRVVFGVGRAANEEENELLADESSQYNDILQEDFVDANKNLTYKAVMGMKWISTNCEKAKYVLKTDDDVVMDVYRLKRQLKRMMESHTAESNSIICFVYKDSKVFREKDGPFKKWYVSREEYAEDVYDDYCDGPFFIITSDLIPRLYNASLHTKFFWVDDVYLTGQLARVVGAKHHAVNSQVWSLQTNHTLSFKNDTLAYIQVDQNMTQPIWQNITLLELDLFLKGHSER